MNSIELFANRYILNNALGQGGMGIVYAAFDRLSGQKVALKQVLAPIDVIAVSPTDSDDNEQVALTREFQTLASLRHPNIINVIDYGFHKQGMSKRLYPYFTMTLLSDARDILSTSQQLTNEAKLYLIIQVLQALEYLHKRGVIHHDLKPSNILVYDEQVKLLDFGLAIKPGESVGTQGTLPYMAPELLDGNPATVASDLYAVGIIAYELFVGRHPYNVKNLHNLIYDIMRTPPNVLPLEIIKFDNRPGQIDPEIFAEFNTTNIFASRQEVEDYLSEIQATPNNLSVKNAEEEYVPKASLARIIFRLLAKDPGSRYRDATTVIQAFNALLDEPFFLETAEIRESYLQAASFVGRQHEQEAMAEALNNVQTGQGSAWLVGGESGVGKTRLIDEVRIRAMVEGSLVLFGQAVKGGGVPYQAWRNILRRLCLMVELTELEARVIKPLVPDIERLLDQPVDDAPELKSKETKLRLVTSITNIIKRYPDPLVLILEDLQWMTDGMDILEAVLDVCTENPLMIIASFRDDERPNLPAKFPQMNFIRLERLTPTEIAELSVSMLGTLGTQSRILDLLNKETEGNVFFLVETVRALAEEAGQLSKIATIEIPSTIFARGIQDIIDRRLSGITAKHQAILQLASIMGREINLPLLDHIVKKNATYEFKNISKWLDVCSSSAIIEVSDEIWRFTHDKIRQGIMDQLTPAQSRQLHTQVALAIEAMHDDLNDYAITLANHWHLAENQRKEWQYSSLAGARALDRGAFAEAAKYLKRALNLYELLGEKDQHWYLENMHQLAQAYSLQGAFEDSMKANVQCLEVVSQLEDESLVVDITFLRGSIALRLGQLESSKEYFQNALELSHSFAGKDEMRSLVLMYIGAVAIMEKDFPTADQNLEEAIDLVQKVDGSEAQLASILNTQAENLRFQKRYEEAIPYYEQSIELFTKIGHFHALSAIPLNLAHANYARGNWELAEQKYYEILEKSLSQNNAMLTLGCLSGIASTKYMRSEMQDAINLIGLVMRHPSTTAETKIFIAQPLIEMLQSSVDDATYEREFQALQIDALEEVAWQLLN